MDISKLQRVVVAVISRENCSGSKEYLLGKSSRNFGEFTGMFYPIAGKVENGDSDFQTLVNELREEVGLELRSAEKITESLGDVDNTLLVWFKCKVASFALNPPETSELEDANLFTEAQMKGLRLFPATQRFFEEFESK